MRSAVTEQLLRVVHSCAKVLGRPSALSDTASSDVAGAGAGAGAAEDGHTHKSQNKRDSKTNEGGDDWVLAALCDIVESTLPSRMRQKGQNENGSVEEDGDPESYFQKYHAKKSKSKSKSQANDRPDFATDSDDEDEDENASGQPMTEHVDVESVEEREQVGQMWLLFVTVWFGLVWYSVMVGEPSMHCKCQLGVERAAQ